MTTWGEIKKNRKKVPERESLLTKLFCVLIVTGIWGAIIYLFLEEMAR